MIVEEAYSFPARRETIWEMLLDPQVIAKTMPGATEMQRVSHDTYAGTLRIRFGPLVAAEFQVVVILADVVPPEHYTMLIDGQGRHGFTRGTAQMRLADGGDGGDGGAGTELRFRADMQVGGMITSLGQHIIDAIGRRLSKQGLDGLAAEVNRRLKGPVG